MRLARLAICLSAALMLQGCLAVADWISDKDLRAPVRGKAYAERECASCHAIGRLGQSPRPDAPSFGTIRMRYDSVMLEGELDAITEVGHFGMPPLPISLADRRDLIAYIDSLR